jgi:hypothetical protein
LPNFKTTIDTTSSSGISISYKIAEDWKVYLKCYRK